MEDLFRMHNVHTESCGEPPVITNEIPGVYRGYFENSSGEQWVFTRDRGCNVAELRGGDLGWERALAVRGGIVAEVILDEDEVGWLLACWHASNVGEAGV